jgi:hypothetical protein
LGLTDGLSLLDVGEYEQSQFDQEHAFEGNLRSLGGLIDIATLSIFKGAQTVKPVPHQRGQQ